MCLYNWKWSYSVVSIVRLVTTLVLGFLPCSSHLRFPRPFALSFSQASISEPYVMVNRNFFSQLEPIECLAENVECSFLSLAPSLQYSSYSSHRTTILASIEGFHLVLRNGLHAGLSFYDF